MLYSIENYFLGELGRLLCKIFAVNWGDYCIKFLGELGAIKYHTTVVTAKQ